MMALPSATLCLCPPDNCLGFLYNKSLKPTCSAISCTFFKISSLGNFLKLKGNPKFSATVRCGYKA